ncbi:MAG TPA: flagellar motor switch protein FliN [Oligoflexia bacterium]|nr:flagellar motor switch protein FliN [Oligoflexia bacterium]
MADQAAEQAAMNNDAAAIASAMGGAADAPAGDAGGAAAGGSGEAGAPVAPKKQSDRAPVQTLDFILDIPLRVTCELGRTKMLIRDILQLAQGSVIELSKFAGEPLEVLVNEKLVARGEVVVVNEKFGIRLTDIISPVERIEQLK